MSTADMLTDARSILNNIETAIVNKLSDAAEEDAAAIAARNALKETIRDKISVDDDLPEEVIDSFVDTVADQITDSIGDSTSLSFTSIFKSLVNSIIDAFTDFSIQHVSVDGTDYSLTYNSLVTKKISLSINKIGTISSAVTWTDADGNIQSTTITWKDFSKSALKSYFNDLKELAEETISNTWNTLNNIADAIQLANVVRSLYSSGASTSEIIKEVFGDDAVKSAIRSEIEEYIASYIPDGATTVLALSRYASLNTKYNQLSSAVDKDKNIETKARNFIKAANKVELLLGIDQSALTITDDGITYDFGAKSVTLSDDAASVFAIDDYDYTVTDINAASRRRTTMLVGNKKANSIIGSSNDDWIEGGKGKDTLLGYDGNDTLVGGAGNDSMHGGEGDDVFIYDGQGNDYIYDYTGDDDIIKLVDVTLTGSSLKGDDVILKFGSKKVTLRGALDEEITIEDAAGNREVYWFDTDEQVAELDQIMSVEPIGNLGDVDDLCYNVGDSNSNVGVNVIESKSIVRADAARGSRRS
ncbi:MAG: hypothetical protein IJU71_03920 [Selenomonadaceae bacterium]|nr:hypothetical protein [Selenomonadaceae bacterium]